MVFGKYCSCIKKRDDNNVNVKMIMYENSDPEYCEEVLNFKLNPNSPKMINNICYFLPRTKKDSKHLTDCLKEGRKILMLSDRREHLKIIHSLILRLKMVNTLRILLRWHEGSRFTRN